MPEPENAVVNFRTSPVRTGSVCTRVTPPWTAVAGHAVPAIRIAPAPIVREQGGAGMGELRYDNKKGRSSGSGPVKEQKTGEEHRLPYTRFSVSIAAE